MRKLCGLTLACVAVVGLVALAPTPVEGRQKGGKKGGGKNGGPAVKLLHQAREAAHKAPQQFNGHRVRAIQHIDHAIKQLQEAAHAGKDHGKGHGKGQGKGQARGNGKAGGGKKGGGKAGGGKTAPRGNGKTPAGQGNGSGHSHHALEQMNHAINQLQQGIKYYEAHHPGGNGKAGLVHAMKLVNKAKQAAGKK
jgi:hypothetical protein